MHVPWHLMLDHTLYIVQYILYKPALHELGALFKVMSARLKEYLTVNHSKLDVTGWGGAASDGGLLSRERCVGPFAQSAVSPLPAACKSAVQK